MARATAEACPEVRAAWATGAGEGSPLTEDRFHQPRLEADRLGALEVLAVEPVGLLGAVTQHLERRPAPLLQRHERGEALGGGHAAAGHAERLVQMQVGLVWAAALGPGPCYKDGGKLLPTRALLIGFQA